MALGPFTVGGTFQIQLTLSETTSSGTAVWDLTGATVTFLFTPPVMVPPLAPFTRTATVAAPTTGVASYTTLTTDLSVPGNWTLRVHVVQGAVDVTWPPGGIGFSVAR